MSQYYRGLADSAAGKHGDALVRYTVAETAANEANRTASSFASLFVTQMSPNLPPDAGPCLQELTKAHLALVTDKAQKHFVLLARKQMELLEADGSSQGPPATSYAALFSAARGDFIATNDTALRALLHEFRDHGLVVGAGSPEALWIPMRKERLASVLKTLPEEK